MGRHCELCGTHEDECKEYAVHFATDAEGLRYAREMRIGWREHRGMAAGYKSGMQPGLAREQARAAGAAYALKQGAPKFVPEADFEEAQEQEVLAKEGQKEQLFCRAVVQLSEEQKYQVAQAKEQLFCRDVVQLSEKLTGHVFSRMEWEGRAVDRPAVVWMHGDFEGGRTWKVTMPCAAVVEMRVERAQGPALKKRNASEEPA